MSARKQPTAHDVEAPETSPPTARAKKKPRAPRVRLTHFEIHRGEALRIRIAVADDALAEIGDELGALIKKIAPSTRTSIVTEPEPEPELVVSQAHDPNDVRYHESLRDHLVVLIGSLCDASLADALEIARQEQDRRTEGSN